MLQEAGWWGKVEVMDPGTGELLTTRFNPSRVKLIFDVNTRMAHSAGRWQRFQASAATHPYLRYITKRDERVRASHRAWDGLCLPIDDPFWRTHHPPNGWRCRCRVIAVSQDEYERLRQDGAITTTAPPAETVPWLNIQRLLTRLGDLTPAMAGIDTELEAAVSRRFETTTDPLGHPWAAWAPSTLKDYPADGNHTLLDRYGDMLDSLNSSHTRDTATVGFGVPYAAYHEWGTEHMPRRGPLMADPDAGTLSPGDTERVLEVLRRLVEP